MSEAMAVEKAAYEASNTLVQSYNSSDKSESC